ncbi:MAG: ATP phosphoribosyltransferase regulatory subunit [bacterium]|nr:ATP phosphoribosyltransferase regulatory subunit [bacterium]
MGITCCKGMRDILPAEINSWYYLENIAFRLVEAYGYREIRTPLFENKELFTNCIGRDSGTVQNKLWTIKGHNGESWALRPDMTASTLRAYCEHRLYLDSDGPTKLFYLGPVFQHSSGRKSLNWQGYQFGLEALGTEDPASDTEVIMMANDLCQALGLPKVRVHLNTLGCEHCRPVYQQMLSEFFARHSADLCPSCLSRYKNRPLWVLGCPEECCRSLASIVPSIHSCLCEDCEAHFRTICAYLSELKVDYIIDPLVVRDVDCYNRTIFQVACAGRLVAFGGRYDGMAARMAGLGCDGADANAVGCSMDIEPLLNLMDEMHIDAGKYTPCPKVCFVGDSREAVQLMLPVLYALRRNNIVAELRSLEAGSEELSLSKLSAARFIVELQDADVRNRVVTFFDGELDRTDRMSLDEALTIIGRELKIKNLSSELRPADARNWSIATRSHHTLDGSSRLRRVSEPKTRSRSRRLSLKTEQLLPVSMRESRTRKNTGYAVPVAREKVASSHVRKRRRPENEDSLETSAVEPLSSLVLDSYPEPTLAMPRREKRELDLPRPARSSLGAGRSRSESTSGRERKPERLLYSRSEKLNFSDVENLVYSRSNSRHTGRLLLDQELSSLNFSELAASSERFSFRHNDDEFSDTASGGERHGKRRLKAGKDTLRHNSNNKSSSALYADEFYDKPAYGDADKRPNIIQNINRWASERYGIAESDDVEALPALNSAALPRKDGSRSRVGRQSLARNRELKALAEASADDGAAGAVDVPAEPEPAVELNTVAAHEEEPEVSSTIPIADSAAEEAVELPASKPASSKRRSGSSKRRTAEKTGAEHPSAVQIADLPQDGGPSVDELQQSAADSADSAADAVAESDENNRDKGTAADSLLDAEVPKTVPRTKGKRGVAARRTLTSVRRTATSARRSSKKAAQTEEQLPEAEVSAIAEDNVFEPPSESVAEQAE